MSITTGRSSTEALVDICDTHSTQTAHETEDLTEVVDVLVVGVMFIR